MCILDLNLKQWLELWLDIEKFKTCVLISWLEIINAKKMILSAFTEGREKVRLWIITTNNILQITRKISFLTSNTLRTRNGFISKKVKTCKGIIRVNGYVSVGKPYAY